MKELTIEEKAKAYDYAVNKAKELILNENGVVRVDKPLFDELFPSEMEEYKDEKIRKELIDYFSNFLGIDPKKIITWLERQGKKKPYKEDFHDLLMDVKFGIDPSPKQGEKKSFDYENTNMQQNDFAPKSAMEVTKEEKADNANKAELKYHKGDWVVTDKCDTVQIRAVNNGYYTLYNGMIFNMSYVDKCWHRWTIQDAKDGDVLVAYESSLTEDGYIILFKELLPQNGGVSYCHYNYNCTNPHFEFNEDDNWLFDGESGEIHPATKEQRDLLFQKMSDAGYAFDFDKKELKKIEQKPAEWSEEDENRFKNLIELVKQSNEGKGTKEGFVKFINRLHSIKNRVQPQPKQEWSKDDEQYLLICKNALSKYQVSDKWDAGIISRWLEERLKSIRPQKQWKPSNEQIGALEHFVRSITESGFASPYDSNTKLVYSLFNDLKKLREE